MAGTGNLLLTAVPAETLQSLGAEVLAYEKGEILFGPDETPEWTFFPHTGAVVSVVRSTSDGSMVEAGVVGHEGGVSIHTMIAEPAPTRTDAIVQMAGEFTRIATGAAREYFQLDAAFRDRVLAYTSNFLNQITQNTVCNRLHAIEQRLAKWLLTVRDRVPGDELHLTHDFLAHMLGIHRPGVSIAVHALEIDGLIAHGRNRIAIRDDEGLLNRSCECYGLVHDSLEQLRATLSV